jgi:DNA-directed RNA polymerase subunit H (RpoH/RPB5)
MESLEYEVKDYQIFSINEIDAMHNNSQLDILLKHKMEDKKVYIKYYISSKNSSKQIRPQTLDTIIEDLYEIDNVLTPKDTLVIIIDEEPNETIMSKVKYVYERTKIFVVIHNIKRLQFNLLEHTLIPKVSILSEKETEELKKEYALRDLNQLPEICRFDPLALAVLLRPNEIVKLIRNSPTALTTPYYRVCV